MDDNRPLGHHSRDCDCVRCLLSRILSVVRRICHHLNHITTLELTIMPKTIQVGQTATAHLVATGTDGKPFTLSAADTIVLAAATPADVTFAAPTFNADGSADVLVTGVNADPGDAITADVDGVTSSSDVLTIDAAVVKVASVTLTLQ